jgi:hypothetical protein
MQTYKIKPTATGIWQEFIMPTMIGLTFIFVVIVGKPFGFFGNVFTGW